MRYVAAYLLAAMGILKDDPTAADLEKILSSVGIEAEADKVKKVMKDLAGKNLEELIAEGATRLASMPAGGAPAAGGGGAAPSGDAAPAAAADVKKEEKKEESDESDDDMGFGLFD
ncbi:hypothetical protein ACOMHN_042987 [Nucella lapillus]